MIPITDADGNVIGKGAVHADGSFTGEIFDAEWWERQVASSCGYRLPRVARWRRLLGFERRAGRRFAAGKISRAEARRTRRQLERDRLSGWNPATGVYEKGGLRARNGPPPPKGSATIPRAPASSGRPATRTCRSCGCSDLDACVDAELGPCWWVAADLCSHCAARGDLEA